MRRNLLAGLCIGGAVLAGTPLVAHHSLSAEFDVNKPITFTGTITQVDWTNPHIYTHVEVTAPDGGKIVYKVEGGAPNSLFRQGWRKETLKTGSVVTVTGLRAKNPASTNIGQAVIVLPDGRKLVGPGSGRGAAQ
jgi:hypothetical protein